VIATFICDHGDALQWMKPRRSDRGPLVRRDGELKATDWDEALDRV